MSNYCNEYYEQNNFTNTYSLWENSRYYDINNLSPHNRNSNVNGVAQNVEFRATKWSEPTEGEAPKPPDTRNRRVVERETLYEDPDAFYKDETTPGTTDFPNNSGYNSQPPNWTELYWHKSSERHVESDQGPSQNVTQIGTANNIKQVGAGIVKQVGYNNVRQTAITNHVQKKLDNDLTRPVKMAKAESMMEKMGWHGGALGRTGNGIMEPVTTNAIYTQTRIGFGQTQAVAKPPAPKNKRVDCKHYFDMNTLLHIYEFVKNNNELELLFDRTLWKDERKRIHHLVQDLLNAEDLAVVNFSSNAQMDLVLQISDKNCYVLCTQSDGEPPNRRLCIYKEAPPHVYLIIPYDLRQGERDDVSENKPVETEENIKPPEEPKKQEEPAPKTPDSDTEVEEESNPFLRSITRNLKKPKSDSESEKSVKIEPESEKTTTTITEPEKPAPNVESTPSMAYVSKKIIEYFKEFAAKEEFTQLKFLGPFNEVEISAINEFIDKALDYLNDGVGKDPVFDIVAFQISEDCTGNTVLMKRPV